MRLTPRAVAALRWCDIKGVHPKGFKKTDRFVRPDGEVVFLEEAIPHDSVWLPTLEDTARILKSYYNLELKVIRNGDLVMISADFFSSQVEGAGTSDQDATLSFLERFQDAYNERVAISDRRGDS